MMIESVAMTKVLKENSGVKQMTYKAGKVNSSVNFVCFEEVKKSGGFVVFSD